MSISSEPFTIALAALEPTAQASYTILDRLTTPTPEVRRALLNPPEFYFKIFFLSRMLEVRFPVPPPSNDSLLPTLITRAAAKLQYKFENYDPVLSYMGSRVLHLSQIPNGAALEMSVLTLDLEAPNAHRQSISKVRARLAEPPILKAKKFDSQESPLSRITSCDLLHQQEDAGCKERYGFELFEDEESKEELLVDTTKPLEYAERYNYDMYEDYAIISLKLKNRAKFNRRFRCPFLNCRKIFKESGNLSTHIRSHTGERPFVCKQCGQDFIAKGHLDSHLMKHQGFKPFVCSFPGCGKEYARANRLKVHERGHVRITLNQTGQKPFVCDLCDKAFTDKTNLLTHLRIHSGERPFVCDCGKSFVKQSHLSDHQKCHQSTKKFECPQCGSCFKRKRTLNYHVSHKHSHHMKSSSCKRSPTTEVKQEQQAPKVLSRSNSKTSSSHSASQLQSEAPSVSLIPPSITPSISSYKREPRPIHQLLELPQTSLTNLPLFLESGCDGFLSPSLNRRLSHEHLQIPILGNISKMESETSATAASSTVGSLSTRQSSESVRGSPECQGEEPQHIQILVNGEEVGKEEEKEASAWAEVCRKRVGVSRDMDRTNSLNISRKIRKLDSLNVDRSPQQPWSPRQSPIGCGGVPLSLWARRSSGCTWGDLDK